MKETDIVRIHERVYRFKISFEDYDLIRQGIDNYFIDKGSDNYEVGDLARFDNEKAFSENLYRIRHIRTINSTMRIVSLERIK